MMTLSDLGGNKSVHQAVDTDRELTHDAKRQTAFVKLSFLLGLAAADFFASGSQRANSEWHRTSTSTMWKDELAYLQPDLKCY